VLKNQWIVDTAPLQLYSSALVFAPEMSIVKNRFKDQIHSCIYRLPRVESNWNALLQTLEGHSNWVSSVAFSHDSAQLASGSDDKTIKIWDASSGDCIKTLGGHSHRVSSVAFSHDSARLASGSYDRTVKIWDASSGACLQTLNVDKWLQKISFDSTGLCLYTDFGTVSISGTIQIVVEPQIPTFQNLALSSDGAWIAHNLENIVWLPSEYRPSCSAVLGKTVGILQYSRGVYV
jgi:WD40 repeat protein